MQAVVTPAFAAPARCADISNDHHGVAKAAAAAKVKLRAPALRASTPPQGQPRAPAVIEPERISWSTASDLWPPQTIGDPPLRPPQG